MPSIGITASSVVRTVHNLLPNDGMASFEAGSVAGWQATNGAVAATQAQAHHGTWAMQVTMTGSTGGNLQPLTSAAALSAIPVVGGAPYTGMCYGWTPPGVTIWQLAYDAWNAAGSPVTATVSPNQSVTPGAWALMRLVQMMPVGAAFARLRFVWRSATNGTVGYVDRVGLFAGDVPPTSWTLPSQPALG